MREDFAKWITKKAKEDEAIYLLVGDIGYGTFDTFKSKFPNRFINLGLCEQTLIGVAAGMALNGLKPYVYSIIPFVLERPYEAIKIDVVANKANVKIVGFWNYPTQGITHLTKNPRGICKLLEIDYKEPKNPIEVNDIFNKTYDNKKPCFIYLTRNKDI